MPLLQNDRPASVRHCHDLMRVSPDDLARTDRANGAGRDPRLVHNPRKMAGMGDALDRAVAEPADPVTPVPLASLRPQKTWAGQPLVEPVKLGPDRPQKPVHPALFIPDLISNRDDALFKATARIDNPGHKSKIHVRFAQSRSLRAFRQHFRNDPVGGSAMPPFGGDQALKGGGKR